MTTWPLGLAAKAANISPRTIRRWIDNGVIKLKRGQDVTAKGSGSYCGLSRNRILQIAIARHLIDAGLSRAKAAQAASEFSDKADSQREPSGLYPFGRTLLISDGAPRVINADFDARVSDFITLEPCAVVLDCGQITNRVDKTLLEYR
jgi:hypothetical protein